MAKWHLGNTKGECTAVTRGPGNRRRIRLGTHDESVALGLIAGMNRKVNAVAMGGEWDCDRLYAAYAQDRRDAKVVSARRIAQFWTPLKPHFGHLAPEFVDKTTFIAYRAAREKAGVGTSTIRVELTYMATALKFGREELRLGYLAVALPRPPPGRPRERFLTREELALILRHAHTPHIRLAIILMVATLGRPSHVCQLTWDRCSFKNLTIDLDNKGEATKKGRAFVPMNEMAEKALHEAYTHDRSAHGYVIEYNGKPVASILKGFDRVIKAAEAEGLAPGVTRYTLRHTGARWMIEAGVPIELVAQYLGHSTSAITFKVYGRFSPMAGTAMQRASSLLNVNFDRVIAGND